MLTKKSFILALLFFFAFSVCAEANIVLNAIVANSSKTQKRKIPFKSYLPKEIKPENVVDKGDLDLVYDPKEASYYVYKEFELGPQEKAEIQIELEDVWKIPQNEISSIREEVVKLTKVLANTDYYERAAYLKNSIDSKLYQIEQTQKVNNPNPGGYISDYRENLQLLQSVKADLAAAKTLVAEAKNISPMVTWRLIIAIVAFLGVLGLIFFIIWQRQIRSLSELTTEYKETADMTGGAGPEPETGERRQAQKEKKSDISDIEDRLKEKPEE
jgi:hypothetical protein